MRRFWAIARTTALELISEPFVMLVLLSALALSALAPAIHYHQFGEPTRMARDAGLSALLVGGLVVAVFGAVKAMRDEFESGTVLTVLSHSVSRTRFFLAKTAGVALVYLLVALAISGNALTMVNAAEIASRLRVENSRIAAVYGPSLALSVAASVVPLVAGAALNRFARFRFTPTATLLAVGIAVAGTFFRFDPALAGRTLPVYALGSLPALLPLAAAAAFATRLRTNAASALTALVFAAFLPALGNYCLADVRPGGEAGLWRFFALAALALVPAVAAMLALGVKLINGRDIG